ncbi:cysteine synthase family protein (plasmid) [Halomicrobium sp. IBSBa]|uniref:PLP-dependent cysteine synthase family protein n=1 Tax=Halomicrobium sp. IBSBa TaxID=2778916 RepID=UPI001ABEEBC0|nr:cysteine synthase family protein [Halomicrobium sp. IBSBa]MBO4249039.1 cysteine synthase family protein [Halomicrobium sp. IBSBa]
MYRHFTNEAGSSPYEVGDPVLSLTGNTPLIKYPSDTSGNIHVKLEMENPTRSMKDRVALGMILEMQERGQINADDTIVEASSGNTAGAVAMVCNRLGYKSVITTPETTSKQKKAYIRALGAELVTCPPVDSDEPNHYRTEAERIAQERDGVFLNQYQNQLNPEVHEKWTGPELWQQADDITHIVCPMGTGGTLSGIAKYIKEVDEEVTIVGVDAEKSNISTVFYDKSPVEYDTTIEGLGKGKKAPTMWFNYIDKIVSVGDNEAIENSRRAARDDGLLIGTSSGAALSVAKDIATKNGDATVILIACDGAEQYFDRLVPQTDNSQ